jgi:hypothetical protein
MLIGKVVVGFDCDVMAVELLELRIVRKCCMVFSKGTNHAEVAMGIYPYAGPKSPGSS